MKSWLAAGVVAVVAAAAAFWGTAPSEAGGARWRPFQAPDVLQIIARGDAAVSANVQSAGGRIVIKAPVELVFRDVDDATAVEVEAPRGRSLLALGDDAATATITQRGLAVTAGRAQGGWNADDDAWRDGARVRLAWDDGVVRASVDGTSVVELDLPSAPTGRARIEAFANSGFDAVACERGDGDRREARPDGAGGGASTRRRAWAAFAAAFAVLASFAWRRRVAGEARGEEGLALESQLVGGSVGVALLLGVWTTLGVQNAVRLEAPRGPFSSEPWALSGPAVVERGGPLHVDRRDGDFVFEAEVVLDETSALDVLLRGAPIERDRGLVLSLSSDERMASGLHANLGTSWVTADTLTDEPLVLDAGVPHAVRVRAEAHVVQAWVDGELLAELEDVDLRAGRTAFYALRGRATLNAASIAPLGEPGRLEEWLTGERTWSLGWLVAALAMIALVGARDLGAATWLWPLAVVVWPDAPFGLRVAATLLAFALAAAWPDQRRRVTTWVAGALVAWIAWDALAVKPQPFEPSVLNATNLDDVSGDPFPPAYAWARHPLCRRFNGYLRTQSFRGGGVDFADAGDATRIVALGSSSTFGYGVGEDETFAAYLDRRLGDAAVVLNAGVPGGHAERFVSFVREVVVDLEPDVLVITLGYNDHIQGGRYDERAHFAAMTTDGIGPLGRMRAAYDLWSRSRRWHQFYRGLDEGAPDPDDVARFETEPAARFGASIEDMVTAAKGAGIDVVLVQEPIRPGEDKPVLAAYHAALADVAERTGALLVATQPPLDAAGADVFVDIVHPNAAGHRLIAAELARALTEAGLVDP